MECELSHKWYPVGWKKSRDNGKALNGLQIWTWPKINRNTSWIVFQTWAVKFTWSLLIHLLIEYTISTRQPHWTFLPQDLRYCHLIVPTTRFYWIHAIDSVTPPPPGSNCHKLPCHIQHYPYTVNGGACNLSPPNLCLCEQRNDIYSFKESISAYHVEGLRSIPGRGMILTSWGQADKVVAFGYEVHALESFHRRSISQLGSCLLVASPFMKMRYTVISVIKEIKEKQSKLSTCTG